MNIKKIILISLFSFSVSFGMDNLRNNLINMAYHMKRGFKTGVDTGLYLHTYHALSNQLEKLRYYDQTNTGTLIFGPYIVDNISYSLNNDDLNKPLTLYSHMFGCSLGIAIAYTGIATTLKLINFLSAQSYSK